MDDDDVRDQRRASRRWPLDARVSVTSPVPVSGRAVDISAGGMCAVLSRQLAPGMRCRVRIEASEDNSGTQYAQVVWVRPSLTACTTGLRFL